MNGWKMVYAGLRNKENLIGIEIIEKENTDKKHLRITRTKLERLGRSSKMNYSISIRRNMEVAKRDYENIKKWLEFKGIKVKDFTVEKLINGERINVISATRKK